jgi:hypothetical protein
MQRPRSKADTIRLRLVALAAVVSAVVAILTLTGRLVLRTMMRDACAMPSFAATTLQP